MINAPTMEQLNKLPRLYETEHIHPEDKVVHLHFTLSLWHWWAIEWDGQNTFFGFVMLNGDSQCGEFGFFNLSTLLEIKVEGWLEAHSDPFWTPTTMKDIALIRKALPL